MLVTRCNTRPKRERKSKYWTWIHRPNISNLDFSDMTQPSCYHSWFNSEWNTKAERTSGSKQLNFIKTWQLEIDIIVLNVLFVTKMSSHFCASYTEFRFKWNQNLIWDNQDFLNATVSKHRFKKIMFIMLPDINNFLLRTLKASVKILFLTFQYDL